MLKKLLAMLSSFSVAALATTSVLSCISAEEIMNRTVDTKTYYGSYGILSAWHRQNSTSGNDNDVQPMYIDTVLKHDKYGNIVGDIADGWKFAEDGLSFQIHLNEKGEWFGSKGERLKPRDKGEDFYRIRPHHFANLFRYNSNPVSNASSHVIVSEVNGDLYSKIFGKGGPIKTLEKTYNDLLDANIKTWTDKEITTHQLKKAAALDVEISKYIKGDFPENSISYWTKSQRLEREEFQKTNKDYILEFDNEKNTVTFPFDYKKEYFENTLTDLYFSPLPDEAVDWYSGSFVDPKIRTNINALNFGKRLENILYAGPYYVSEYNPNNSIKMKANPNYHNQEDLHIKNIILFWSKGANSVESRMSFENLDRTSSKIESSDIIGWKKYIGDNLEEPVFEGVRTWYTPEENASWTFFTNFLNRTGTEEDDLKKALSNQSNMALTQHSTRALIYYALNRSDWLIQRTRNQEKPDATASNITRNFWLPKELLEFKEEKDKLDNKTNFDKANELGIKNGVKEKTSSYFELVNDNYLINFAKEQADRLGKTDFDAQLEKDNVDNGKDGFYANDFIASQVLSDNLLDEFKTKTTFNDKLQVLIKQVKADFEANGISTTKRHSLDWLIHPSWKVSQYGFIQDMTKKFNSLPNNPVKIDLILPDTNDDFGKLNSIGNYHFRLGGYGVGTPDPEEFLGMTGIGSTMDSFHNISNLAKKLLDKDGKEIGLEKDSNGKYIAKNKAYQQILNEYQEYSEKVDQLANRKLSKYERLNIIAQAEMEYIYKYNLLFTTEGKPSYTPYLSYIDQFSRVFYPFGVSKTKIIGLKMIPKLWTKERAAIEEANYNAAKAVSIDNVYNWFNEQK